MTEVSGTPRFSRGIGDAGRSVSAGGKKHRRRGVSARNTGVFLPRFIRACFTAAPGRGRQLQTYYVDPSRFRVFITLTYGDAG